jgi:hypothetical protein
MTERTSATAYPLSWPLGRARTENPRASQFGASGRYRNGQWSTPQAQTPYSESQRLLAELQRIGAENVLISTNLPLNRDGTIRSKGGSPSDAGVAVYFDLPDDAGRLVPTVLACDRWRTVPCNLHAIALHVEALRGMERWGVGSMSQAFAGYAALPARASGRHWSEVLGVLPKASAAEIKSAYRERAKKAHPDQGGTREEWDELQEAWRTVQASGLAA